MNLFIIVRIGFHRKGAEQMLSLDEAIRHAEEVAELLEESAQGCDLTDRIEKEIAFKSGKCAEKHRQLAEWLRDYKRLLEQTQRQRG